MSSFRVWKMYTLTAQYDDLKNSQKSQKQKYEIIKIYTHNV